MFRSLLPKRLALKYELPLPEIVLFEKQSLPRRAMHGIGSVRNGHAGKAPHPNHPIHLGLPRKRRNFGKSGVRK
jgi:hypothetical protein